MEMDARTMGKNAQLQRFLAAMGQPPLEPMKKNNYSEWDRIRVVDDMKGTDHPFYDSSTTSFSRTLWPMQNMELALLGVRLEDSIQLVMRDKTLSGDRWCILLVDINGEERGETLLHRLEPSDKRVETRMCLLASWIKAGVELETMVKRMYAEFIKL